MSELNLSPSQASAFHTCQRKWAYSYIKNFKEFGKPAPDLGSAIHRGLDAVWLHASNPEAWEEYDDPRENAKFFGRSAFDVKWADLQPEPSEDEWRGPDIGHPIIDNYVDRYWEDLTKYELLGVEESFKVRAAAGLNIVGRVDKIVRDPADGKVWVIDAKTTSSYSKEHGIQPAWFDRFHLSEQVSAYIYAANFIYGAENVGGFIADAILIHPKRHDVFERRSYTRTIAQLKAFEDEMLAVRSSMTAARELGVFPKNTNACSMFGLCSYSTICHAHAAFRDVPDNPPDTAPHVRLVAETTEDRLGLSTGDRP